MLATDKFVCAFFIGLEGNFHLDKNAGRGLVLLVSDVFVGAQKHVVNQLLRPVESVRRFPVHASQSAAQR
jgi:hypothetical protein